MKKMMCSLFAAFALVAALQAGITETKSFKGASGLVEFELSTDKPDWKIKVGEPVTFSAQVFTRENAKAPRVALTGRKVLCRLFGDGLKTVSRSEVLSGKPVSVTGKLDRPGWIYAFFTLYEPDGKTITSVLDYRKRKTNVQGGIGALVEPEKLKPGMERPADFDAFWKAQRELLNKVPLNAVETPVTLPPAQAKSYKLFDVKVDCAGGMPVRGYLSIPANAKPKSLPAWVTFHGAGVSSSGRAMEPNCIRMDVNAHGILNGQKPEYYSNLYKTTLKNYYQQGKEDREKIYFHGMYLRVMRALDYVKSRPEWNGKVLIVSGSSQGGGQTLAAAALDPQVTLCVAGVPALSDHAGSLAGRQPGWPRFYDGRNGKKYDPAIKAAAAYYDNVFFAPRIKCEAFVTTGLIDTTCSPEGVYVVFTHLASPKKQLDVVSSGNHGGAPMTKGYARIREVIKGK